MHSKYSPSSLGRKLACPGSHALEMQGFAIDSTSKYAAEGTAAHEELALCLETGTEPKRHTAPLVYALTYIKKFSMPGELYGVETTLRHSKFPDFFGTVDYYTYFEPTEHTKSYNQSILNVYDYKHGEGVKVKAKGNKQLMAYCLLICDHIGKFPDNIVAHIIQPRHREGSSYSKAKFTRDQLLDLYTDIRLMAQVSEDFNLGDHCRFCPVKHECPKIVEELEEIEDLYSQRKSPLSPVSLSLCEKYRRLRPLLMQYLQSLDDILLQAVKDGHTLTQWKPVQTTQNRQWNCAETTLFSKLNKLGLKRGEIRKLTIMSPTQVLKRFPEIKDDLEKYIHRPNGKIGLVPIEDKREAVELRPDNFYPQTLGE